MEAFEDTVGSTYRQVRSVPRKSEEGFEVTTFDPPRRVEIKGVIGPSRAPLSKRAWKRSTPSCRGGWLAR